MSDNSDFSNGEDLASVEDKKNKKGKGLISAKKEKKEKKVKEKETRYGHLEDDSSGDEEFDGKSPAKSKKSKPFMFGSAKKDKREKKDCKEKDIKEVEKESKKKDKKEKPKLKLKKSKQTDSEPDSKSKCEECPIFGVPLAVAAARNRCHDGVALPAIVRQCVDHIEAEGLMMEGIYRSSGVKSKMNKLRSAYNSGRPSVTLYDYEPAVVASVLKQFLRELPDPVLTRELTPRFEEVSASPQHQKRIEGMKTLLLELPECNRLLIQWIFVHMSHVIERERFNKMTLQNVSIVLSPTMQISHRVLNCFFENSHILFDGVQLKKYVPPITAESGGAQGSVALPESPEAIAEEIRKQESLLAELHQQISRGANNKKVDEQIWEQQRIVTQLKRKLRLTKKNPEEDEISKPKYEPIVHDYEIDFTLQSPKVQEPDAPCDLGVDHGATPEASPPSACSAAPPSSPPAGPSAAAGPPLPATTPATSSASCWGGAPAAPSGAANKSSGEPAAMAAAETPKDSPESQSEPMLEHKVRVMVHRSQDIVDGVKATSLQGDGVGVEAADQLPPPEQVRKNSHVTVIALNSGSADIHPPVSIQERIQSPTKPQPQAAPDSLSPDVDPRADATPTAPPGPAAKDVIPLLPPPPASTKPSRNQILRPVPASPAKPSAGALSLQPPPQTAAKSKSLPRGLPSSAKVFCDAAAADGPPSTVMVSPLQPWSPEKMSPEKLSAPSAAVPVVLNSGPQSLNPFPDLSKFRQRLYSDSAIAARGDRGRIKQQQQKLQQQQKQQTHEQLVAEKQDDENLERLRFEALRLKFEYEELMTLKSEMERRKKAERNEIEEVRDEIATMQSLYQYRTYSVDSSESSSADGGGDGGSGGEAGGAGDADSGGRGRDARTADEAAAELAKVLNDLVRENRELSDKRLELCQKIKDERAACVSLRVQIRLEQEKMKLRR